MAAQYVLQDRTLATKWALNITSAGLDWDSTADAAQAEPIVEDDTNPGTYWRWFMDNGVISIESTLTVQDDLVDLEDTVTGTHYKLAVNAGSLDWQSFTPAGADIFFDRYERGLALGMLAGLR